jgi:ribosomal protein S18 acetylase RimI-like enzyme
MFGQGLQSTGMTCAQISSPVELFAETAADAAFVDGLTRGHLLEAMGGFDPGPLLEMQMRSRDVMLTQRFPDLERRIAWIGEQRCALLLTGALDGALHVAEIIVAPEWRRRGVGAAVLARVAEQARAQNRDVTASIFVSNIPSLSLFSSAGFALDLTPGAAQVTARLRIDINVT